MVDKALHVLWLEIFLVWHYLFKRDVSDRLEVGVIDFTNYHNSDVTWDNCKDVGLAS